MKNNIDYAKYKEERKERWMKNKKIILKLISIIIGISGTFGWLYIYHIHYNNWSVLVLLIIFLLYTINDIFKLSIDYKIEVESKKKSKMKYTKEEIIKRITSQLDECLELQNAEIHNYDDKILDVDTKNQTITIKFNYHVVEEDDYIGLGFY